MPTMMGMCFIQYATVEHAHVDVHRETIYSKLMNNHQRVQMETDCLSGRIQGGDLPP